MTSFYFTTTDLDTTCADEVGYDLPDFLAAIGEAKKLLAEMALDGIPTQSGQQIGVEITAADGTPLARLRLVLDISYPPQG